MTDVEMEQAIRVLEGQVRSLRRQVHALQEWQDTVSSPVIKRLWWVIQGYRWHAVGRWYRKTRD